MNERCTCGAVLPEDARFCHKCGRPQYEEDLARLEAEEAPARAATPVAARPAPVLGISFKNSRAVTISGVVAGCAFFGSALTGLLSPLLWPLVLLAAGFVASSIYKSGSAEPLSSANGARLGWMTGLWLFLVLMIGAMLVSIYLSSPAGTEVMKKLRDMPQFQQMADLNKHDLVMNVLVSAIPTFFMVTLISGLGGILGARFGTKRRPSS